MLLNIQVHDDSVEAKDTDQFKQAEQLELFGLFFIVEEGHRQHVER